MGMAGQGFPMLTTVLPLVVHTASGEGRRTVREDLNYSHLGTNQAMPLALARCGKGVWGRKGQVQVETEVGSHS